MDASIAIASNPENKENNSIIENPGKDYSRNHYSLPLQH